MNDTNSSTFSARQRSVLLALSPTIVLSSSDVQAALATQLPETEQPALITIKRDLDTLTTGGYCAREGKGRSTAYRLTNKGRLERPFSIPHYLAEIPDTRATYTGYVHDFFATLPPALLPAQTLETIDEATTGYTDRASRASSTIKAKEMERFVIELSWKSSAIEGNTYTLLDTEKLLREGIPAPNHDPAEAHMIVNHKKALEFVVATVTNQPLVTISQRLVEQVHELLTVELDIQSDPRSGLVGITGSAYTPLDNSYQIGEALTDLYQAVEQLQHPVEKALLTLAGLSYIQPFEDGNKRTARLMSNAILLSYNYAPLSYRNVEIDAYRGAMLIFYEQLSLTAVSDIFVNQYLFSTEHYLVQGQ